jgi:hypothetical protein
MFNNAKIYNVDESYIFKYASRLEQALANKYKTTIIKKEKPSQPHRILTKKYYYKKFTGKTIANLHRNYWRIRSFPKNMDSRFKNPVGLF